MVPFIVNSFLSHFSLQHFFPFEQMGSRLNLLHLAASGIAVLLYVSWRIVFKRTSVSKKRQLMKRLHKTFFDKTYWWNSSTQVDYGWMAVNGFMKTFLLSFFFALALSSTTFILRATSESWSFHLPVTPTYLLLATFVAFVIDDFLRFYHHWLMHKIPWLWHFHKVHHAATTLTPFTLLRIHTLESVLAMLRNSFSQVIVTTLFILIFRFPVSWTTLFGVSFFSFIFNFAVGNLRHSHIGLRFPRRMERWLISPYMHQIHHSSSLHHRGKNLGVTFSLWDRLWGTLLVPSETKPLQFGLGQPIRQTPDPEFKKLEKDPPSTDFVLSPSLFSKKMEF